MYGFLFVTLYSTCHKVHFSEDIPRRYSADYSAAEFGLFCTDRGTFEGFVQTAALEITDFIIRKAVVNRNVCLNIRI